MKIEYIQKCKCGAVTIRFDNSASNSMFWETFEKLDLDTGDATWLHQSYCCDHCVNHWGIGLCGCGSRPTIEHFITRMVEHNNGIALLFNRLDNKMFQDVVFPKAKGILFMKGRIKFHREDGTIGESLGCGSILVAFGEENAEILRSSNIEGRYIQVNQEPCNTHVDWEQRRYEMAKTMLPITSVSGRGPHGELILEACDKAAELAVTYADALIKELK